MYGAISAVSMSEFSNDHYLNSILADVRNIKVFVTGLDFDAYASDLKTQYACERAILNISEAVRNFEKHGKRIDGNFELSMVSKDIEWAKIKGIGNVMRHDYENVTNSLVWQVTVSHLDHLEQACLKALR